jgi:hypothetical protein
VNNVLFAASVVLTEFDSLQDQRFSQLAHSNRLNPLYNGCLAKRSEREARHLPSSSDEVFRHRDIFTLAVLS